MHVETDTRRAGLILPIDTLPPSRKGAQCLRFYQGKRVIFTFQDCFHVTDEAIDELEYRASSAPGLLLCESSQSLQYQSNIAFLIELFRTVL